jgi:2-octaprenyl-6-methoxyphenol hydroxylase
VNKEKADIAVVGAGPVGTMAAVLIARRRPDLRLRLLERGGALPDNKHIVLNFASRRLLEEAGVWKDFSSAAPITNARISFAGCLGRVAVRAADAGVCAVGYALPLADLQNRLRAAAQKNIVSPCEVTNIAADGDGCQLRIKTPLGESSLRCRRLIIAAEVAPHFLPGGIFTAREDDYRQDALVADVAADAPPGIAWERFGDSGALALVPKSDGVFALIWSAPREVAVKLSALDTDDFIRAVRAAGGRGWPRISALAGDVRRFALKRRMMRPIASGALALIGQGANTAHPVGAQGLNLGMRDAGEIAKLIHYHNGAAFAEYAKARKQDHRRIMAATNALALLPRARPLRQIAALAAACAPRRMRAALSQTMIFGGGRGLGFY